MPETQTTIAPHSLKPVVTRQYPGAADIDAAIEASFRVQKVWRKVPLEDRIGIGRRFMTEFEAQKDRIAQELSVQMGRPIRYTAGEVRGTLERAEYMLSIAEECLGDVDLTASDKPGFHRYIKREPLGVVLVVAPWNYPYLVMINVVLPALLAGNTVLLKPSPQTPLTAELLASTLLAAGLPTQALQVLHLTPGLVTHASAHPLVNFISFTGSVLGGKAVERAAVMSNEQNVGVKGVALELGGKDPAYVREDADLGYAVEQLVDGAMFNSGQSCCAIERIYVHQTLYDRFVEQFVALCSKYVLGDPLDPSTTLGPVVSVASASRIRAQVAAAVKQGARQLVPQEPFVIAKEGSAYVAPMVLVDVNHEMDVMMTETFGPVVGIQSVSSDAEALKLMNDSPYGLTASIWTSLPASQAVFNNFVEELETGTVYANRCDYLDPALAWTGVKDSGRGVSLSRFGFDQLTRAKSVNMKIATN
ncbi:NAD-aldehyde dehydrogenase [Dacryopinax primogenitus]|uniref:NAD-aldehyde dehydrogenase n=1 Tax=Dacryopinax primogenitus (strain DJM 731) TaxID=1858805 RepID=M5FXB8_DACPD|nr:NAD-aldehyde dehydrogenase [Dacryopinax primogenitus]EJT98121.1 NAD-aldehyde dehydrogenase [Dacryopinax primogenitus]